MRSLSRISFACPRTVTAWTRGVVCCLVAAWGLGGPRDAGADLVFFHTGRTLSVESHRIEGDQVTLHLRGGGEVVCSLSLIARIAPDEVPYPVEEGAEPLPAVAQTEFGSRPYASLIRAVAGVHGVDEGLVHAVVQVESSYQPRARSPKGARGLMQLMPSTAAQYRVRDAYDPESNLDAGVRHLKGLLGRFDLARALAAYNAGEATVLRYGGIPPFPETQAYVRRVLSLLPASF